MSYENIKVKTMSPMKTYSLRESLKGSAKDRMRLHELSLLLEVDSQSVFFTKEKIIK